MSETFGGVEIGSKRWRLEYSDCDDDSSEVKLGTYRTPLRYTLRCVAKFCSFEMTSARMVPSVVPIIHESRRL